jgi:hypothetical protein
MTPYRLVGGNRRFGGTYRLQGCLYGADDFAFEMAAEFFLLHDSVYVPVNLSTSFICVRHSNFGVSHVGLGQHPVIKSDLCSI